MPTAHFARLQLPIASGKDPDDSDNSSDSSIDEAETAAVEMLLEAYFMQFDHTYNRLQVRLQTQAGSFADGTGWKGAVGFGKLRQLFDSDTACLAQ